MKIALTLSLPSWHDCDGFETSAEVQFRGEEENEKVLLYLPTLQFAAQSSSIFEPRPIDHEQRGKHYARNMFRGMAYTPVIYISLPSELIRMWPQHC